jgi:uncharacterized protein YndB with AHSA1/START domain
MTPQAIAPPRAITLRLRRRFPRTPEAIFRAWTDPEMLRRWWCPAGWTPAEMHVDLRVGGAYHLGMRPIQGGAAVYVRGRFLEVSAPDTLIYTWKWENAFEDMPETRVTVKFTASAGATEVELTHECLPEIPLCLRHRTAWIESWQRLKAIL